MTHFLIRLRSLFRGFSQQSSTKFDETPDARESLTRFLFSKNHFSVRKNQVKPDAFLPAPSSMETSVFRMKGLGQAEVQELGDQIGARRGLTLKAWADLLAGVVFNTGLSVRPDNVPERHAVITGWPQEKHEQLSLAQELAASAALRLPAESV